MDERSVSWVCHRTYNQASLWIDIEIGLSSAALPILLDVDREIPEILSWLEFDVAADGEAE